MDPVIENKQNQKGRAMVTLPWRLAFAGFVIFLLFSAASAILALAIGEGRLRRTWQVRHSTPLQRFLQLQDKIRKGLKLD